MAAIDVLPSSPGAPWTSSFDDYLDIPSPMGTPRLTPLSAPSTKLEVPASASMQMPPPPGSSPESLFRYYLSAELRKIGITPDEATIDRYVSQHYDSFTRAMERHQENGPSTSPSIFLNKLNDEEKPMSEDEIEEHVDEVTEEAEEEADEVTALKGKGTSRTVEETPIEGSIMGPSNELRPDPETYHTLTSKEKRQLRNKISARNFRTRRKEHIAHLEQQVADRDTLIEGLRQQLAKVTLQNKDLQEEMRTLKTKSISSTDVNRIIEALQKSTVEPVGNQTAAMGPPSTLTRTASNSSMSDVMHASMQASSPRSMSPRPSAALARPNTRKDVSGTSVGASGARSFWEALVARLMAAII
ncbi:hypothetical protein L7F22_009245 [Adiantum nelumboides]|nr:hypothetical protein [Adiantum nelumboides]